MALGIYVISNTIDDRIYIGSSKNITRRFKEHKKQLKNKVHSNRHLLNFVNKYGIDSLIFEQILECSIEELRYKEQYCINEMQPQFNICKQVDKLPVHRKYSDEEVHNIAELYNSGKSLCWIAEFIYGDRMFRGSLAAIKNGVYYSELSHLFNKRQYSQVGRKLGMKSKKLIGDGNRFKGKIKKTDLLCIIDKLNNKEAGSDIAVQYNVHRSVIYNIKNGKTHKEYTHLIKL